MADYALWERRVAEWKASGEPSTTFTEGRDFSSSALRYWAKRLEREQRQSKTVALARLVRVEASTATGGEISLEIGSTRITVGRGFDRETLRAVVEVLSEGTRAR